MDIEYAVELKIPKDRVAVLIGKNGEVKRQIERATHSTLDIDSKEGDVAVRCHDAVSLLSAKEVVKAISRGFNPDIAQLLVKPDYSFEVLNMQEYLGKSKKKMIRISARVIGTEGKARRLIEEFTETHLRVYGKTVGIIGPIDRVTVAKQAVEKLFAGSPHSAVYMWLEKKHRAFRQHAHMNTVSEISFP